MLENIITSLLAFVSTNIDDIFILMLFYGRRKQKPIDIVLGQYLGIGTLVLVSFVGAAIGSLIDQKYIGLLGLFPIYLALKNVQQQGNWNDEVPLRTGAGIIAIAGVTIANGGDNIGVYVPLLTTMTVVAKVYMVVVFAMMTYVWCMAARYLARHPVVASYLDRFGNIITPLVLFGLGIFILWESGSFLLFF
ncbi:cadmium resistance transporter [Parachryseolinea silvisoli]|uniref:cadmium resistance transporter n=1 Tax=Parachryseolinea silvisoli TaxID=2873601 RepID=UPI002265B479|nr:cadmium resistance transporter [Parachryseolinea silvisoli]MCD9015062.1 cadmium resistance transporter [Parachryseolinea silvisoli]